MTGDYFLIQEKFPGNYSAESFDVNANNRQIKLRHI